MTKELLRELDSLIALMEDEIPANPSSERNEKQAEQLEKELRKYFRQMEQAIPEDKLAVLYNKHVEQA